MMAFYSCHMQTVVIARHLKILYGLGDSVSTSDSGLYGFRAIFQGLKPGLCLP